MLGPAEGHLAVIGADVGGEHGVIFLADLEDALAGLDVERDGQSRLAAPAAANQQQVAVAAEAERVDRPLGERQYADEMIVGRSVEQHLPVPADRHQRRPRARGHGHNGSRPRLGNERLGGQILGHGRSAGRLAQGRGIELELELGLGLDRGRGARGLERTTLDPLADHFDLGVGNLGRVGRHLGLFLVADHAQERAAFRIPRLDDLARSAALQGGSVVVKIQPSLGLVRIVASSAAAAEDSHDMICVSDLSFSLALASSARRAATSGSPQRKRASPISLGCMGWSCSGEWPRQWPGNAVVSRWLMARCQMADGRLEDGREQDGR